MKNEEFSIDFSLDTSQLSDMLKYLSSSNSFEIECSFEREDSIEFNFMDEKEIMNDRSYRPTISEEIK